jgi:hypothetical protein
MVNPESYKLIPEYNEYGRETGYYTRNPDGVSGMTVAALADFVGVESPTITQLLNRIRETDPLTNKLSECLKPFAGEELRLITNDLQGRLIIPDEACHAVAEYYAFEARQYPGKEIAINNFRTAGRAGMRVFIWSRTGYAPRPNETVVKLHTTVYVQRIEGMRDHQVPDELWMIFRESAELLLQIEKEWRVPINDYDILDGSIGRKWSSCRSGNTWAGVVGSYIHKYRDKRGFIRCAAYEMSELPHFRRWLRETYIPEELPKYLVSKYGKQATRHIYGEINALTDYILSLTEVKHLTAHEEQRYQQFLSARSALVKRELWAG